MKTPLFPRPCPLPTTFAGVAHSYNYYPLGPQKAEEGVVQAVLGLGRLVVDGGRLAY